MLASDRTYRTQLAVALTSLLQQHTGGDDFEVYILTSDIVENERSQIVAGLNSSVPIHWVDVPSAWYEGLRIIAYLTVTTAFRLMMAEVLPTTIKRVVYLDADTLIRNPLTELFTTDLCGHVLGAVQDAGHPWVATVHSLPWRTLALDPAAMYFNGGVLAVDLDAWRAQNVGKQALDLLRTYKFAYADQCALNATLRGHFLSLPPRFNAQSDHFSPKDNGLVYVAVPEIERSLVTSDPAIVHFSNGGFHSIRPWFEGSRHRFADEWLTVLAQTAFADQPLLKLPSQTRRDTARQRLKRAAYILARG